MMQELKKYQINILGETYSILSDESEQDINETIRLVDSLVKEVTEKSSVSVDGKKVALFVALKIASKLKNMEQKYNKVATKELALIQKIDEAISIS